MSRIVLLVLSVTLYLVKFSFQYSAPLTTFTSNCQTTMGQVNRLYSKEINSDYTLLYMFSLDLPSMRDPLNTNIRLEASVGHAGLDCPVIFVIGQQRFVSSLEIPFSVHHNSSTIYYEGSRTLCVPKTDRPSMRNVTVRVSTCSQSWVNFSLKLSVSQDYIIPLNQEIELNVSPSTPMVRGFLFDREHVDSARLSVISKDTTCMTVSVQPLTCPIYYQQNNVQYNGLWQTMTGKAAMTIEKNDRFEHGFAIALVVHHNDKRCSKVTAQNDNNRGAGAYRILYRQKTIKLKISSDSQVSPGILCLCLLIPVMASVAVCLLTWALFLNRHKWLRKEVLKIDISESFANQSRNNISSGESVELNGHSSRRENLGSSNISVTVTRPSDSNDQDEEEDAEELVENGTVFQKNLQQPSASTTKNRRIEKTSGVSLLADIYIGDFFQNEDRSVKSQKNSRRFCWSLITVAIFYTIPVYQLIFHYLRVLYRTGEYDICYYNYFCSYRVGFLIDFNHFFSNIGYIIFGLAFIIIVRRRDSNMTYRSCDVCVVDSPSKRLCRPVSHLQLSSKEDKNQCCCCFPMVDSKMGFGVPPHFGVFYALGLALVMEGFLSAAYHVCPNQNSFQFDTCFMYVISVLSLVKVYQFRHPVSLDAHQTFLILAGLILVSVAGLMLEFGDSDSALLIGFRITFTTFQFLGIIIFSLYYYSVGYLKDESQQIETNWRLLKRVRQMTRTSLHLDRLVLPLLTILLCAAVVVYSEIENLDFATYLLYTFVANVLGSCFYYILIMKPLHREFKQGMWIQPSLYFIASGVIGGFAVYYFVQTPAVWEKSASESRSENNMECMKSWFPFRPFYDVHDVWHFYSAAALFLAFMGLLTVDDDLISTPQNRIPVF